MLLSIHPLEGLIRLDRFDFLHFIYTSLLEGRVTKVERLKLGSPKIELGIDLSLILKYLILTAFSLHHWLIGELMVPFIRLVQVQLIWL
jgi:hypothetical protein